MEAEIQTQLKILRQVPSHALPQHFQAVTFVALCNVTLESLFSSGLEYTCKLVSQSEKHGYRSKMLIWPINAKEIIVCQSHLKYPEEIKILLLLYY